MNISDVVLDVRGAAYVPDPENPGELKRVVFQGCSEVASNMRNRLGKPMMQREYVVPADPMTTPQLAQRSKMRIAVQMWQDASPLERQIGANIAEERNITLYMGFLAYWLPYITPVTRTIWDAGATSWDLGATLWDI